ncbi:hypothetical protein FM036_44050 [Nostoc sp. HG1]|nr:hypothetical protein [Nostoc sp. HG1]
MTNRERPKSAVVERMGSSATFARQLYAVTKGNFRNIQARARVSQVEKEPLEQSADFLLLLLGIVLEIGESFSTDITLRLDTVFSKEFQGENR